MSGIARALKAMLPAIAILPLSLQFLAVAGCAEKKPASTTIHFVTWKPNAPEAWGEIYRIFREEHPGRESCQVWEATTRDMRSSRRDGGQLELASVLAISSTT